MIFTTWIEGFFYRPLYTSVGTREHALRVKLFGAKTSILKNKRPKSQSKSETSVDSLSITEKELERKLSSLNQTDYRELLASTDKHFQDILNDVDDDARRSYSKRKKKNELDGPIPGTEFMRLVHISQISKTRTTVCRLLANETERKLLQDSGRIFGLTHFSANMSISWVDNMSIKIKGILNAIHGFNEKQKLRKSFETALFYCPPEMDKTGVDESKYDETIREDGNIDIGDIARQYLQLALDFPTPSASTEEEDDEIG
jgi:hypothetical protein